MGYDMLLPILIGTFNYLRKPVLAIGKLKSDIWETVIDSVLHGIRQVGSKFLVFQISLSVLHLDVHVATFLRLQHTWKYLRILIPQSVRPMHLLQYQVERAYKK